MNEGHAPDHCAGPDYGMILAALINDISIADHMGDVKEAVDKAAELAGLLPSDPELDDDGFYQVKWRGAEPPCLWKMKP